MVSLSVCPLGKDTYMGDSPLSIALSALSSLSTLFVTLNVPIWPTVPNTAGNHFLFAAATVIRPATKELPSSDPAITRQIRTVAKYAPPLPSRWLIAVCWRYQYTI
jgi:hypothetical protein